VQDKLEFEEFILNFGLRLDWFDARSETPTDPTDPNIFSPLRKINQYRDTDGNGVIGPEEETPENAYSPEERREEGSGFLKWCQSTGYASESCQPFEGAGTSWYTETDPKWMIAPRIGAAYPISAEGVIHFSFGLFFQAPTLNRLFDNYGYKIPALSGTYGPFGNPDLEPERSTMYEIGFKQGFGDFVVDVTGFYRDVRNWVATSTRILTAQPGVSYVIFANRDYSNVRGITASFQKTFSDHYGFDTSYTFQVVEGSNSDPSDEFFALQNNDEPTLALLPLNWDQRHKVAGAFYLGGDSWGASTRFRFESGFPYTPYFHTAALVGADVRPEFDTNARRMASTWEFDLSLYKEFTFAGVTPRIFLDVFNVFDTRNVAAVFSDTGRPDLTLFQFQTGSFDPGFWVRSDYFREPRRMQLGVQLRF
jgi:outer membrane receptor protein involved in Fe transport